MVVAMDAVSLLFFVWVLGYFLPTLIAALRGHSSGGAIFALNLFLGWTLIGWVVALVMALLPDRARELHEIQVRLEDARRPEPEPPDEVFIPSAGRTEKRGGGWYKSFN